jgi:hypothetical protein
MAVKAVLEYVILSAERLFGTQAAVAEIFNTAHTMAAKVALAVVAMRQTEKPLHQYGTATMVRQTLVEVEVEHIITV